ncbi:hypothetical protein [Streptomyces sp. NPDC058953]|uniref:terpene synthase family protein n=1 Tax=unclassified Streptomyces TaxID=2593676 RepID=UPI003686F2EF
MSALVLPALEYPFDSPVSPLADEVDEECFRWGLEQGIYRLGDPDEYRRIRVGWLAARTAPRATPAGLRLLADWQMWLFAFDDGFRDESEHRVLPATTIRRLVDLMGALEAVGDDHRAGRWTAPERHLPATGDQGGDTVRGKGRVRGQAAEACFRAALEDLAVRLHRCTRGYRRARFISAVRGYFLARCWEAAHRSAAADGGTPPPLAEYVRLRRYSSAVRTCIALADAAGGIELPAPEYDVPEVAALTDMAVDVTCWAHDIVSYPHQTARGRVVHGLPAVLGHWRQLDPQEALYAAARMHDEQVRRYLAVEASVRDWASPPLRRHLDGLRYWMSGNLGWSLETGRYPRSDVLAGQRHG